MLNSSHFKTMLLKKREVSKRFAERNGTTKWPEYSASLTHSYFDSWECFIYDVTNKVSQSEPSVMLPSTSQTPFLHQGLRPGLYPLQRMPPATATPTHSAPCCKSTNWKNQQKKFVLASKVAQTLYLYLLGESVFLFDRVDWCHG